MENVTKCYFSNGYLYKGASPSIKIFALNDVTLIHKQIFTLVFALKPNSFSINVFVQVRCIKVMLQGGMTT